MNELTPEKLAELRRDAERCASDPNFPHDGLGRLVRALPALLDAAAERDEIAGRLAHLLCDLTGGRMSKTSYPVPVMAQEIEQYLSEYHESDLKDERDALAAAVERVRALHWIDDDDDSGKWCGYCQSDFDAAQANEWWPCPTIRALDESEADK